MYVLILLYQGMSSSKIVDEGLLSSEFSAWAKSDLFPICYRHFHADHSFLCLKGPLSLRNCQSIGEIVFYKDVKEKHQVLNLTSTAIDGVCCEVFSRLVPNSSALRWQFLVVDFVGAFVSRDHLVKSQFVVFVCCRISTACLVYTHRSTFYLLIESTYSSSKYSQGAHKSDPIIGSII